MKALFSLLLLMLAGGIFCTVAAPAYAESAYNQEKFTQKMIERSLVSVGNTQRMQAAMDKARRGEEVTLVYLGGSITEGALAVPQATKCYAYLSAQMFAERYCQDPSQLHYVNAGISGTPSLLGVTRCERDVLRHQPDVVFVEFAVNDGTDEASRMAYESLVRKLLKSESSPAVVLLFTINSSLYSAQVHMQQVGKQYDLGMISVGNAIKPEIQLGRMTYADYSSDYAHPTTEGHAFIADMISYYFDQAAATPAQPYEMAVEARYASDLENLTNIRDGSPMIEDLGSLVWGPAHCYSYKTGWRYRKGENQPLILTVEGRHMTIAFQQENKSSVGTAEVYVDGKLVRSLNGSSPIAWGNVVTELIQLGEANGAHTVEIRMAEADASKDFMLLDMAVAK